MAVPKKKISHSKTKKRFFATPNKFTSYVQCNYCLGFNKLHCKCYPCFFKGSSVQPFQKYYKTNIFGIM